jgi:hypothetical protein
MGFDAIWHVLVLLFVLAIIVLAVRLLRGLGRGGVASAGTEARLRELDSLKARGLVTEAEYQRQRSAIIGGV